MPVIELFHMKLVLCVSWNIIWQYDPWSYGKRPILIYNFDSSKYQCLRRKQLKFSNSAVNLIIPPLNKNIYNMYSNVPPSLFSLIFIARTLIYTSNKCCTLLLYTMYTCSVSNYVPGVVPIMFWGLCQAHHRSVF